MRGWSWSTIVIGDKKPRALARGVSLCYHLNYAEMLFKFILSSITYNFNMRILVIEDEKKIANNIKKGLEYLSFAVDVAYDGEQGLDFALTEPYDVIVLDLMLPKIAGIEVCKTLREEKIDTPILMLTAKGQLDDKLEGFNVGTDDYMVKPFDFDELVARIKALASRPRSKVDNELLCGNLSLNTNTYVVKIKNDEINLSKKEYALLEFLLRNKEKVVSKDKIIENVWDFDADVLPNTVEVYVNFLRKKIDEPYETDMIKTVRGFGYKISCS